MKPADEPLVVRDESSYHAALATLSRAALPERLLRHLMNSFEGYRQARKIGWSRPWNKYGMNTFLALRLRPAGDDISLITELPTLLGELFPALTTQAGAVVDELLSDPLLLGFLFLHESEHDGVEYEGLTLSLGRKQEKRYRDRLDLVFELPVNALDDPSALRIRVYLDPWRSSSSPPLFEAELAGVGAAIYSRLIELAWSWQADHSRHWDHWTSRYIDYFGPRRQQLTDSHLPLEGAQRLAPLVASPIDDEACV